MTGVLQDVEVALGEFEREGFYTVAGDHGFVCAPEDSGGDVECREIFEFGGDVEFVAGFEVSVRG